MSTGAITTNVIGSAEHECSVLLAERTDPRHFEHAYPWLQAELGSPTASFAILHGNGNVVLVVDCTSSDDLGPLGRFC